ncbi:hypothetical protein J15TS10_49230 [Paenibacillus woosongensis]|uniref:YolD-like protein n=2 Tax=Paenibacillus woosongensis TaxID=307580 RepID=A0ABQ4MYX1_9BACL|nr:hypothetical protein J15TS10_49230 [Paenibacillus woosongensis]
MNKLTSGGNMIWESSRMIMPQHKEAAQRQLKEELKRERLELDDQEKEQIARFMTQALKTRQEVRLRMYHPYENIYLAGVIDRLESLTARFRIDGEWFLMEDIMELSWNT